METFIITFIVFVIAISGMAIGVIISNRAIKGSCGGLNLLMGSSACDICDMKDRCEKTGKKHKKS